MNALARSRANALAVQIGLALARRDWAARGKGAAPAELSLLIAEDAVLQGHFDALEPGQRQTVEAAHWVMTKQLTRARALAPKSYLLSDHRDPLYLTSANVRLRCLLDTADKTEAQQESDAHEAAVLLDHMLSLTLVSNLNLATQRIALAHRFGDTDYLTAVGWIMARRLASAPPNAPEQMKDLYRAPLGAILKPYASRDAKGRLRFSDPALATWYGKVRSEMGEAVFPAEYRRKK